LILPHQCLDVARAEELDSKVRIEGGEAPQLSTLLPHQCLPNGGDFNPEFHIGEVEVRREPRGDTPIGVVRQRKCGRFVLPADPVEVKDFGKLRLALMREGVGSDCSLHRIRIVASRRIGYSPRVWTNTRDTATPKTARC